MGEGGRTVAGFEPIYQELVALLEGLPLLAICEIV